ncbi:hypothetical protein AAG906_020935 [Vitis piasezkii]
MKSKMMVNDLLDLDDHIPNSKHVASKKPQLIHSDIAGPQRTPSLKTMARNTHLNHSINSTRRLPTRALKDRTPFEDVHFMEDEKWNWEDAKQNNKDWQNDMVDDVPVKGTRLFSDVYQRYNIAICEPADYEEAMKNHNWMIAMKEELSMIEKNKTWVLLLKGLEIGRLVMKGYNQIFSVDYSGYICSKKIYVEKPEGIVNEGEEDKVCLLKKALYG